jgi:pimeloyl-ACP methyl ester carboxylesterase
VQRLLLHEFERAPGSLDELRALRMPLLSICGTRDRFVRPSSCDRFVKVAPAARVQLVRGAGHVVGEEAPDIVNAALLAFLGEDSSGVATRVAAG